MGRRKRGRRGERRTSVEDLSVGDDAAQTRATGECFLHPDGYFPRAGPPPGRAGPGTSSPLAGPGPGPSSRLAGPDPCQDDVAEPPSAQTQQQTSVSYLSKLLGTTTLKESSITATSSPSPQAVLRDTAEISPPSGRCLSSSPRSTILVRKPPDWYFRIYIRIDHSGSFHTYSHMGGPFQSLQEAEKAIDCYLHDKRHKTMWKEQPGVTQMDRIVKKALYWPDGRTRKCSNEQMLENTRQQKRILVQALVDKYNEDHNLFGDLAYELKDVLHYQSISENRIWYNHFNFTTNTKGSDDFDCDMERLFFAEVTYMEGGHELVVSCLCMIEPNENGHCYGCINNGSTDMKHPNKANAYAGGHLDAYLPFGRSTRINTWTGSDADVAAEEARLRHIYKGLDDQSFLDKYFTPPSYATPMVED